MHFWRAADTPAITKLVPLFAYCEQEMVSSKRYLELSPCQNTVERIQHYQNLPLSAPVNLKSDPSPDVWPSRGDLNFSNVSLRYASDLPLAVDGFNLRIRAGRRVAIVGRSGAGKSSITQAIFRLFELDSGSIEVDGYNLSAMGLETVSALGCDIS